jgi:hypothetical protein
MAIDVSGTWELVAWRRHAEDGTITYPLGDDAEGVLLYTPDGQMAVVLTAANRPTTLPDGDPVGGDVQDRADAYSTCLAYVGTYEVRESEVVHRVSLCLYPKWANDEQVRPFTYTGDELTLRTPPTQTAHGTVVNELEWRRRPT